VHVLAGIIDPTTTMEDTAGQHLVDIAGQPGGECRMGR
jgi:hypothetical protein